MDLPIYDDHLEVQEWAVMPTFDEPVNELGNSNDVNEVYNNSSNITLHPSLETNSIPIQEQPQDTV